MADLVVQAGQQRDKIILDAVGPDIFTFEDFVRLIANKLHRTLLITQVNPTLAFSKEGY